jgi:hypothetical protein
MDPLLCFWALRLADQWAYDLCCGRVDAWRTKQTYVPCNCGTHTCRAALFLAVKERATELYLPE